MQADVETIREAKKQFDELIPTQAQQRQKATFLQECKLLFQYPWASGSSNPHLFIHQPIHLLADLADHATYSAGRLFIGATSPKLGDPVDAVAVVKVFK